MSEQREPRTAASPSAPLPGVLSLPAEAASVPRARRFVQDVLAGHDADLVDRAEACISELVTNAVLHARTEVQVHVEDLGEAVRLEVRDRSTSIPRRLVHTVRSATGRGMEMVGLLARAWGVDLLEGDAKSVWCELDAAHDVSGQVEHDAEALLAAWPDDDELLVGPWTGESTPVLPTPRVPSPLEQVAPADGAVAIVLVDYPVRLGIRAREHTAGVLRECALLSQATAPTIAPARLVTLAERLTTSYSSELGVIDQQRTDALLRGDDTVDLAFPAVASSRELVLAWQAAMEALDEYAAGAALLSLATPPRLVEFRDWMVEEMLRQTEGQPPRPWTGELD
ncbi:ATP-binding protein [Actinotalea solisilvae]|uniref:ATP-binding protein n=1 Tax=Actinotalea solisilvae TaxID=2072922 RepID=UPI0018F14681|nr:ATP-binding protein [Actinotalea solisilvae]